MKNKSSTHHLADGIRLSYCIENFDYSWHEVLIRMLMRRFQFHQVKQDRWWIDRYECNGLSIDTEYQDDWTNEPKLCFRAVDQPSNSLILMIINYIETIDADFSIERTNHFQRIYRKLDQWVDRGYRFLMRKR